MRPFRDLAWMVAVLLAALLSGVPAQAQDWTELTSEKGNFKIAFPVPPKEVASKVPLADAEVTVVIYVGELADKQGAYLATFNDYPEKIARAFDPAKVLDENKLSIVGQYKGKITKEADVTLDGHPGKAFSFTREAGGEKAIAAEGHARVFLVGGRVYRLLAIGDAGRFKPEELEKFFGSFARLVK